MSNVKHGMARTPEYLAWTAAKTRCFNPAYPQFHRYGGRGIAMCPEWDASFEAFFDHIGPRPSSNHSLDRINNDGDYEPGNVRWALPAVQRSNQSLRLMCRKGLHEMAADNILEGRGGRRCRACTRAKERRRNKGTAPEPQPCGTPAAYQRHRLNGERPCDRCRDADNAARRARRAAKKVAA